MRTALVPGVFAAMLTACGTGDRAELEKLRAMQARFAPVEVTADTSKLSEGDRAALEKLLEAARVIDDLFVTQVWSGNAALREKLRADTSELGRARLRYFELNKGPWSDLDEHAAFLPGVPPRKPPGANFYPEDMTREEFEAWAKERGEEATGFFTLIRRDASGGLRAIPYSAAYSEELNRAAALLEEAAALTPNASLAEYLRLRAEAFRTNDYYASDVAWMKVDAPIDATIGPYETYMDELFGYKAAFEAYITLRDDAETARLQLFADHLQEVENNLPLDDRYKNPKLGALAPIRVVNQVLAAGDGAHGVRTAAFNLPNDERVVREYGSKRVMLKNVQEAKFNTILLPVAARVLPAGDRANVRFGPFFTHILAHEMSHGIGPHNGVREALKELYSAVEEAKADITGLFMLQFLMDRGLIPREEEALYTTFLASSFRTMRFGVHEAHGRGMAVQFNYLLDRGAFVDRGDGTFAVDLGEVKNAVRDLTRDLLTMEATRDYNGAREMLEKLGTLRPSVDAALKKLGDLPVDIEPVTP
jgi:hypothetical protein